MRALLLMFFLAGCSDGARPDPTSPSFEPGPGRIAPAPGKRSDLCGTPAYIETDSGTVIVDRWCAASVDPLKDPESEGPSADPDPPVAPAPMSPAR